MADEQDPNAPVIPDLSDAAASAEETYSWLDKVRQSLADMKDPSKDVVDGIDGIKEASIDLSSKQREIEVNMQTIGTAGDTAGKKASRGIENIGKSSKSVSGSVNDLYSKILDLGQINIDGRSIGTGIASGIIEAQKKIGDIRKHFGELVSEVMKGGSAINTILGSGSVIAASQFKLATVKAINDLGFHMLDAQQKVMDLQKAAVQSGIAFGKTFDAGSSSADMFRQRYTDTMLTLNASEKELQAIGEGFRDTLDTSDQIKSIQGLAAVQEQFGTTLTATNAALAIGSATGIAHGEIAADIGKMYTQLGEDMSGAIKAFGEIGLAADGSGLSFNKVKSSILSSTESLKMWGGTVGAVAPLFKTFSENLKDGQKGLAPDILNRYVEGLQNMGFETRALLGITAGGGGAVGAPGGAIGAGLEMEAALEQGEAGMAKISDSLVETLKRFGGGQVVTREEAIENPALQRNFMIQRGLLKQMLGVNESTANKMMGALQSIDQNGLAGSEGAQKKIGDLLASGKAVQESTTGELKKAQIQADAAQQNSGAELLAAVKSTLTGTKAEALFHSLERTIEKSIVSGTTSPRKIIRDFNEANKKYGAKGAIPGISTRVESSGDKALLRRQRQEAIREIQDKRNVDERTAKKIYARQQRRDDLGVAGTRTAQETISTLPVQEEKRIRREATSKAQQSGMSIVKAIREGEKAVRAARRNAMIGGDRIDDVQNIGRDSLNRETVDLETKRSGDRKIRDIIRDRNRNIREGLAGTTTYPLQNQGGMSQAELNERFHQSMIMDNTIDKLPPPLPRNAPTEEQNRAKIESVIERRKELLPGSTKSITRSYTDGVAARDTQRNLPLPVIPPVIADTNDDNVPVATQSIQQINKRMGARNMGYPIVKTPLDKKSFIAKPTDTAITNTIDESDELSRQEDFQVKNKDLTPAPGTSEWLQSVIDKNKRGLAITKQQQDAKIRTDVINKISDISMNVKPTSTNAVEETKPSARKMIDNIIGKNQMSIAREEIEMMPMVKQRTAVSDSIAATNTAQQSRATAAVPISSSVASDTTNRPIKQKIEVEIEAKTRGSDIVLSIKPAIKAALREELA